MDANSADPRSRYLTVPYQPYAQPAHHDARDKNAPSWLPTDTAEYNRFRQPVAYNCRMQIGPVPAELVPGWFWNRRAHVPQETARSGTKRSFEEEVDCPAMPMPAINHLVHPDRGPDAKRIRTEHGHRNPLGSPMARVLQLYGSGARVKSPSPHSHLKAAPSPSTLLRERTGLSKRIGETYAYPSSPPLPASRRASAATSGQPRYTLPPIRISPASEHPKPIVLPSLRILDLGDDGKTLRPPTAVPSLRLAIHQGKRCNKANARPTRRQVEALGQVVYEKFPSLEYHGAEEVQSFWGEQRVCQVPTEGEIRLTMRGTR